MSRRDETSFFDAGPIVLLPDDLLDPLKSGSMRLVAIDGELVERSPRAIEAYLNSPENAA